jgi:preprotein translocase subunit SecY
MTMQCVSKQTQKQWWINTVLFTSAVLAALSGVYFLYLPMGGFQGGRNPMYNVQILFTRQIWDDLHTWGGVVMIVVAVIHFVFHWSWVVSMARRAWNELSGKGSSMNSRGRWNLILNTIVAVSFVLSAISGIYFLFVSSGRRLADPMILFNRTTWDLIHTYAGITLIATAVVHFVIHWKWVTKVTGKMVKKAFPSRPVSQPVTVTNS